MEMSVFGVWPITLWFCINFLWQIMWMCLESMWVSLTMNCLCWLKSSDSYGTESQYQCAAPKVDIVTSLPNCFTKSDCSSCLYWYLVPAEVSWSVSSCNVAASLGSRSHIMSSFFVNSVQAVHHLHLKWSAARNYHSVENECSNKNVFSLRLKMLKSVISWIAWALGPAWEKQ